MAIFRHILWGFELAYPDEWIHSSLTNAEVFAAAREALEEASEGPQAGHILVRAEWNYARQAIGPIWNQKIGLLAGMIGAKNVGSAPWRIRDAAGLETEIVLPKREKKRLWTGVLMREATVIQFVVTHPLEDRSWFEPAATKIVSSLRFLENMPGIFETDEGLPLPPGYIPDNPLRFIPDIGDPRAWRAFDGQSPADALQAFFVREAPVHGWQIEDYAPFPGPSDLGFARLQLSRAGKSILLGILPYGSGPVAASSPARIALKLA